MELKNTSNQNDNLLQKEIRCVGCEDFFSFSVGEQIFFRRNQLQEPKNCSICRRAKRKRRTTEHNDNTGTELQNGHKYRADNNIWKGSGNIDSTRNNKGNKRNKRGCKKFKH